MESSISAGELEPTSTEPEGIQPTRIEPASFVKTSETKASDVETAKIQPPMFAAIRERCPTCGAALASDQRYCVECGQRSGPARVPLARELTQRAPDSPASSRLRRRPDLAVNSSLIAIIGVLLLAMGVGVLIGRSGNGSSAKSPPAQVVTVGGGAGATAGATATQPASAPTTSVTKSGASRTAAKSKSAASSRRSAAAPPKIVKVGSAGHGPGYQHGHFTGNFFGE